MNRTTTTANGENVTIEIGDRFVAMRAVDPKLPGERLRLDCEDLAGNSLLTSERTLPERVHVPHAQRVERHEVIHLTPDDIEWLHEATGRLLLRMRAAEQERQ